MKGITRIIAFALFLCSAVVVAQPNSVPLVGDGAATVKTVEPVDISAQKSNELLLLKEQNKLIKEFQSSQQATVYWALSGIFAFVVVLMGLSYFTNFKFYEQDKDRIKADFESRLGSYRAEMNLQLEESKRELDKIVERNSQLVQDRTLLQLSEARTFIEGVRSELMLEVKSVEKNFANFEEGLKLVDRKLANAEVQLREVEMEVWELQEVPENMLISLSQGLRAAAAGENMAGAARVISKMLQVVEERFIKEGLVIENDTLSILRRDFEIARAINPAGISKLKKALARVPVEKEEEEV